MHMNYINAVCAKEIQIQLSTSVVIAQRKSLLYHHILKNKRRNISNADENPNLAVESIFEYISLASDIQTPEDLPIQDIPVLLSALIELNENVELLPWQSMYRVNSKDKKSNADYENRELAIMINTLASNYGWSHEQILSLQPEEAACYVQEILLNDWEDREYEYKLSRVAYDEHGKYMSFPKPDWYVIGPTVEQAKAMIPMKFVPDGVVIDVSKKQLQND